MRLRLLLLLLLAGCSSTSGLYEVECIRPGSADHFVYRTADSYSMGESGTLTITDYKNVYYYNVPEGSACRVQPMENSKTYEREEYED